MDGGLPLQTGRRPFGGVAVISRLAVLLATAVALAAAPPALAASPYCIPKPDGTDRIAKIGNACPVGYLATGRCCEALHRDAARAYPKIKGAACPAGTFASGGACVSLRKPL